MIVDKTKCVILSSKQINIILQALKGYPVDTKEDAATVKQLRYAIRNGVR